MNKHRALILITVICLSIVCIPALSVHYVADDITVDQQWRGLAAIPLALRAGYYTWTTRPTSDLAILLAHLPGERFAGVIIILVLIALWLSVRRMLLLRLTPDSASALSAALISLLALACSDAKQSIYWLQGIFTYTFPLIFGATLVHWVLIDWRNRRLQLFACLLIALVGALCAESYALVQGMALVAALPFCAKRGRLGLALLGTGIAFAFMMTSPGDAVRRISSAQPLSIFQLIDIIVVASAIVWIRFIVVAPYVLLLYSFVLARYKRLALYGTVFAVACALIIEIASAYGLGAPAPGRVDILAQATGIGSFALIATSRRRAVL